MLSIFKSLLDSLTQTAEESPQERTHALQLATAVLLVEVMRADPAVEPRERKAVVGALQARFSLPDDELRQLVELAEQTAVGASDFFQFTSRINDSFAHPQKIQMIEEMWQIAFADTRLDAHENHLISKIAALLHVTHGEYIGAKMRAKERARLA
ncbi:MAG: TerB family tellurite resistance protein [Polaromonas sp.]|nr:TerB family tellurite resistance protein [Polaromonas sp.]